MENPAVWTDPQGNEHSLKTDALPDETPEQTQARHEETVAEVQKIFPDRENE